jgi:hypothetical protein
VSDDELESGCHAGAYDLAPAGAGAPRRVVTDIARQSYNLILGFGLSIPVFFVTTYAWVIWIVVPLSVAWWRRLHRRNRGPEVT